MTKPEGRVVTAHLPIDMVERMEVIGERLERTKSWIVKEALTEWLADEERRHQLTLESLREVDEGHLLSHEQVLEYFALKKAQGRANS
jgi:predicted transcriptional regulator